MLLAVVDILVVFNLGRVIAWLGARLWLHRVAASLALAAFLVWVGGFNLGVGHLREALQTHPDAAMTVARDTFAAAPHALQQLDSWILVAIGAALSVGGAGRTPGWD